MRFEFKSDVVFDAKDIQDALYKLVMHMTAMSDSHCNVGELLNLVTGKFELKEIKSESVITTENTKPKIYSLPLNGTANSNEDIAAHLREQVGWMLEEDATPISNLWLLIETSDGRLVRSCCGQRCDVTRSIGIYMCAIMQAQDD